MRFCLTIPHRFGPRVIASVARGFVHELVRTNLLLLSIARAKNLIPPPVYRSGVVWALQPSISSGQELATWSDCLTRGWGDCKDLCAWRVAELIASGVDPGARVMVYWRTLRNAPPRFYHAQIRRTNAFAATGFREDPSRFLGMPS